MSDELNPEPAMKLRERLAATLLLLAPISCETDADSVQMREAIRSIEQIAYDFTKRAREVYAVENAEGRTE